MPYRGGGVIHGGSYTPGYRVWAAMLRRCTNANAADYPRYGGRGITVCDRWRFYENFLADMGPCPAGLTLDRIDGTRGYEPGNCRWATYQEQNRNRRNNRLVTMNGKTRTLVEWCEIYGRNYDAVKQRINKLKWPADRALLTPIRPKEKAL